MRTKRAFINMTASITYLIINMVCSLIVPRLILRAYGSTYNGVISSATQFLEMINILNMGIAGPTRVALYHSLAANDHEATNGIVKATKQYMQKVGIAVIVYAILLMIIYPQFVHTSIPKSEVAALVGIISISTFAQYYFSFTNKTLLSSAQSEYVTHIFDSVKIILNTVLTVILISLNASIFVVKLGSSIVFFLFPLAMELYVRKKFRLDSHCKPDYTSIHGRGAAAFHSIANIIHDNVDVVLLTAFTNVETVSVYSVYRLISTAIRNVMRAFTNALESPFGNLWAKGEKEALRSNFHIYEFAVSFFASVVFSCAMVMILPFISRYTVGVTDVEYVLPSFAFWVVSAECAYCFRQPYVTLVQATGNYEATKKGAMYEAVLNVLVSVVLIQFIGMDGVMIGTLVANIFRTIQYAKFSCTSILNESMKPIMVRFMWMCIMILLSVFLARWVNGLYQVGQSWVGWVVQAVISFIISLSITSIGALLFYKNDFSRLIGVANRVFKRRQKKAAF